MTNFNLEKYFADIYADEKSSAIATLKTLIQFLKEDDSSTAQELSKNVRAAINRLKELDCRTEVESVAEIYVRFITLSAGKFDVSIRTISRLTWSRITDFPIPKFRNSTPSKRNYLAAVNST